ncbi:uncharacterized protein LOC110039208 [Phalaenopsis equestris]|uniref:uncharacterized protein LOC110039208 n=1 Tax=Phalaenopsis equestris TaxID=78828 RepID=UPI0009E1D0C1|nr:uncharacterized protein LOC110039208 [Phalaenopsis equestris]
MDSSNDAPHKVQKTSINEVVAILEQDPSIAADDELYYFAVELLQDSDVFTDLLSELIGSHGLHGSMRMTDREVLAITLYILSQNESMRGAMECFQHSSETISRYFSVGLSALVSLAKQVIKPTDPTFSQTPAEIRHDRRYMSFFKVGRVVHMTVEFSRVQHGIRIIVFLILLKVKHVKGKYYLVDAGYPLQRGYLKPYPDTRYHIPNFERASNITQTRKEVFNKGHSSLRGVIERTFGVWKKKWVILRDMPPYPFPKQVQIVIATMIIHNYIRRHPSRYDVDFLTAEANQQELVEDPSENQIGSSMIRDDSEQSTICTKEGEGATEIAAI